MRVEVVKADSFGSLVGESLVIPPGFVVVYGPNECGKSTWLHAIFFALCGITAGKRTEEQRQFEEKYAPWFGDDWKVSATVRFDDGRRVEVVQDLRRKTGYVTDLTTGKDLTATFVSGRKAGMPDLSRACGVDREFFRYVALVPQAGVLELVRADSSTKKGGPSAAIRRFLESASSVTGGPTAISDALRRIEAKREALGQEGRGGSKPLNLARQKLIEAQESLEKARQFHERLVASERSIKELEAKESELIARSAFLRAVLCQVEATRLSAIMQEARDLAARHPELEEGEWAKVLEHSRVISNVRSVLDAALVARRSHLPWSEDEIRESLEELGEVEEAPPLAVDPRSALASLADLHSEYRQAIEAFGALESAFEEKPLPPDLGRATPEQLEHLAMRASAEPPPVEKSVEEALLAKEQQVARAASYRQYSVIGVVIGVLFVLSGVAVLLSATILGGGLSLIGVLILALSLMTYSKAGQGSRELHRLRMLYETQLKAADRTKQQVSQALEEAEALGLPGTKEELLEVRRKWELYELSQHERETSEMHLNLAKSKAIDAATALHQGLVDVKDKGLNGLELPPIAAGGDLEAWDTEMFQSVERAYEQAKRMLQHVAEQADRARQKQELEDALDAEQRLQAAIASAYEALTATGDAIGEDARGDPERLLAMLDVASKNFDERLRSLDEIHRKFASLTRGRSLEEFEAEVEDASRRAEEAVAALPPAERIKAESVARAASNSEGAVSGYKDDLEATESELASTAEQLAAERRAFDLLFGPGADGEMSVSEAEEYLEAVKAEYEQFKEEAFVLEKTAELLRSAERKIHTLLAPHLQRVAGRLTAEVTLSRYDELFVDDEQPIVRVRRVGDRGESGAAIEAERLSLGTAEQIYLIFRLVVANTAATKDSIPLLLDESTVYADSMRLGRLLEILSKAARSEEPFEKISQVILFTQEEEVARWAERNLPGESLIRLATV